MDMREANFQLPSGLVCDDCDTRGRDGGSGEDERRKKKRSKGGARNGEEGHSRI